MFTQRSLRLDRGILGDRGTQIAVSRYGDDFVTMAESHFGDPKSLVVTTARAVQRQNGRPITLYGVFNIAVVGFQHIAADQKTSSPHLCVTMEARVGESDEDGGADEDCNKDQEHFSLAARIEKAAPCTLAWPIPESQASVTPPSTRGDL